MWNWRNTISYWLEEWVGHEKSSSAWRHTWWKSQMEYRVWSLGWSSLSWCEGYLNTEALWRWSLSLTWNCNVLILACSGHICQAYRNWVGFSRSEFPLGNQQFLWCEFYIEYNCKLLRETLWMVGDMVFLYFPTLVFVFS